MELQQKPHFSKYPAIMIATLGSALLAGCALCPGGKTSTPMLEDVQWAVSDINGNIVLADTLVTLNFSKEGKLNGKASCNGYSAAFERDDSSLAVSQLIQTKRLCRPSSLMEQEQQFTALLKQVNRWEIAEQGQLVLSTASGNTLVAQPVAAAE